MARKNDWESGIEWASTYLEIHENEFPNLEALAAALRSGSPMPKLVAEFLANYLTGQIKRPRGRTKYRDKTLIDHRLDGIHLRAIFDKEYERVKVGGTKGRSTPFETALDNTATIVGRKLGLHLSPEAIKKRLKLRDRSWG